MCCREPPPQGLDQNARALRPRLKPERAQIEFAVPLDDLLTVSMGKHASANPAADALGRHRVGFQVAGPDAMQYVQRLLQSTRPRDRKPENHLSLLLEVPVDDIIDNS
jgi:hypothetical protein